MSKRPISLPPIALDADADVPLYQQLYRWFRDAILAGRYAPKTRLPSTRALAQELRVARNTVDTAFGQLLAEGYIESRRGAGTFVASALPDEILQARQPLKVTPVPRTTGPHIPPLAYTLAFNPNAPAFDAFPWELWSKLVARQVRHFPRKMMGYTDSAGWWGLRVAIADYLNTGRAVNCSPDQVFVVNGSQQALDLSARLLLKPGDVAWMEDPGYFGARGALERNGANIAAVPIDAEGLNIEEGLRRAPNARLAYVTPSFQFPLGVTMSLARRLALLEWANANEAWIVEDDYNSEYRYTERPLGSLQGLDTRGRVIYLGTFSKVLFPALRLAYMVVPDALVDKVAQARLGTAIHSPMLEQFVVQEFIVQGHFSRHVRRMRTLYGERQERLVSAVERYLGGLLTVERNSGGMHLMGWLPKGKSDVKAFLRAADDGIMALPLRNMCIEPYPHAGLLLGYAAVQERTMNKDVQQLARALEKI